MPILFSRLKVLAVLLLVAGYARADAVYIKPADVDWQHLLSGPPAAGSDTEKQEIAKLLEWQNKRTADDILRCKSEDEADPFIFSDVLGDKFTPNALPITAKLLTDVTADIKPITRAVKAKWDRKRPPAVDERIKPCVKIETTSSYPSSHATRGTAWAMILGEIIPAKKDALLTRGKLIGEDRVIAGVHFPSDVEAGQKLGGAVAEKLLHDPAFMAVLSQAKAECEKAGIGK